MLELTPPNGCRHCGITEDEHFGKFYTREAGWHRWTEPTNRMRKERMIARRAMRTDQLLRRYGSRRPNVP